MGRRLIATMATLAIGLVGALSIAAPASAAPTAALITTCSFPEPETKAAAEALVPQIADCLEIVYTDKCDGTTLVQATNWVTNDNKWTVVNLKIDGITKTLRGGSTPDVGSWNVSSPNNRDDATHDGIQPYLIYDFTVDGTTVHVEKKYGDPHVWKDPGEVCQSPSPSPSASATPSPSPSASASGPLYANCDAARAAGAAPLHQGDPGYRSALDGDGDGVACEDDETPPAAAPSLPVTGASATLPVSAGLVLLLAAASYWAVMVRRRRKAEARS